MLVSASYAPVYAVEAPNASQASQVTSTVGQAADDGRVFTPSRLFSRDAAVNDNRTIFDRSVAADPSGEENQKLAAKAQELILRETDSGSPDYLTGEFADFVKSTVGVKLPLFGYDLFAKNDRFGLGVDGMSVPSDYQIRPGDEVIIKAWGGVDIDFRGKVDRSGAVFLPKVGSIYLAGQQVSDLLPLVAKTVSYKYTNFEMTVTMGELRQIQYYVMGFVKIPGVHTTESTATALHGLLASGGPLPTGDLRDVQLKRGNRVVAHIDAYDLLVNGNKQNDIPLQTGDVIFVPPAQGFAALAGSVSRPAIYHLKSGMTLADLVNVSGGLTLKNSTPTIRLERITRGERVVRSFDYTPKMQTLRINDGDIYYVSPMSPKIDHVITLKGNVAEPLRQPWRAGMRVSDVITSPRMLVRPAVWESINNKAAYNLVNHLTSSTQLTKDFPEINWDYAVIERLNPETYQSDVITFRLDKAMQKDPENDIILQDGDAITIYQQSDFKQPARKATRLVTIEGEVNSPGVYPVEAGQTLAEVIDRAGGVTPNAFLYGLQLSRESARQHEATMIKSLSDRVEQDYSRFIASRSVDAVTQSDKELSGVELVAARNLITNLKTIRPTGRVLLNMPDAQTNKNYIPNLVLEDLDRILVPPISQTVLVTGSVFNNSTQLWQPNDKPMDYIKRAGGLRRPADRQGIVVVRADGEVWEVKGWSQGGRPINPGDTIFVPEDVGAQTKTKVTGNWTQILYQLGLGSLAITTLLKQVN